MDKNSSAKLGLGIGIVGFLAGLFLAFSGETFIGIAGATASAGIAYKGFTELKKFK